jgi:hypothetical protein
MTNVGMGYAMAVDVWQFQPTGGVGESSLEQVRVYPNPVNDVLNIVLGTDAPISILSLDGRTIKQFAVSGNTKLRVDVSDLEAGIYLVRVGEATFSKHHVIQSEEQRSEGFGS